MTLPTTYLAALLLTLFSVLCLGSWANGLKLVKKWRFELFYFDFAIGLLLGAILAAFTFGTLGSDGFTFLDDLMRAGKRNMVFALGAGVVFNLGNMLMVGGVSLVGLTLGFPLSLGLSLVTAVTLSYVTKPQGNAVMVLTGLALFILAVLLSLYSHRALSLSREVQKMKAGEHRTLQPKVSWKGVLLCLIGGLLMGLFKPLLATATVGDTGLGPYSMSLLFCIGVAGSAFVFNLFLMNLPIQGSPLEILDYFRGRPRQHAFGILAGLVWAAGAIGSYVAASAPPEVLTSPSVSYALLQGAPLLTALWGLLAWKEFRGADARVYAPMVLVIFLFVAGLVMLAQAPFSLTF
jgi:glucose uptake protein